VIKLCSKSKFDRNRTFCGEGIDEVPASELPVLKVKSLAINKILAATSDFNVINAGYVTSRRCHFAFGQQAYRTVCDFNFR